MRSQCAPAYTMDDDERLCFERAVNQWRRSLKRADMSEEDRVKGALLAYMRQAFAMRIITLEDAA